MSDDMFSFDAMDEVLLAKLSAAQEHHAEDLTPENRQVYRQVLKAFADRTIRGELAEDSR